MYSVVARTLGLEGYIMAYKSTARCRPGLEVRTLCGQGHWWYVVTLAWRPEHKDLYNLIHRQLTLILTIKDLYCKQLKNAHIKMFQLSVF